MAVSRSNILAAASIRIRRMFDLVDDGGGGIPPPHAILDAEGNPVLDAEGNVILEAEAP